MPSSAAAIPSTDIKNASSGHVPKPDEEAHKKQLEEVQSTIDKLQEDIERINEKINSSTDNSSVSQKREELRSQLDRLRGKQAEIRKDRSKTFEQLKIMGDSVTRKRRDLKAFKDKLHFRTVRDIDNQISNLEKQVESGTLKIVDEKRIISEISNLKKSKKTVEACESLQNGIDADQKSIDDLKRTLDDKDHKDTNAQYELIKSELDSINKGHDADREKRNELYEERKRLKEQITAQISTRKAIREQYDEAKKEYRKKMAEDRQRRLELNRKKKEEYEEQKKMEIAARKREDASIPAFQEEILSCENLINYFQTHYGTTKPVQPTQPIPIINDNIRQPDATTNVPEGAVLIKKSDEDYLFGGGKSKKKPKTPKEKKSNKVNGIQLPLSIMEQLEFVKITVPLNTSEVEKTISELEKIKADFEENQDRVTKENIAKAEEEISALENKRQQRNEKADVDSEETKVEEVVEVTKDVEEAEKKLTEVVPAIEETTDEP